MNASRRQSLLAVSNQSKRSIPFQQLDSEVVSTPSKNLSSDSGTPREMTPPKKSSFSIQASKLKAIPPNSVDLGRHTDKEPLSKGIKVSLETPSPVRVSIFSQRSNCGSKKHITSSDESKTAPQKSKFAKPSLASSDPLPTDDADFDDHGKKKQPMPDISPVTSQS